MNITKSEYDSIYELRATLLRECAKIAPCENCKYKEACKYGIFETLYKILVENVDNV